jgi:hypothetical protein
MLCIPPERFHLFLSYTTRDEEVRELKPLVDHFLNSVLRPVLEKTLGEPQIFYDGYTFHQWRQKQVPSPVRDLRYGRKARRDPDEALRLALKFGINESELLLAFVSDHYLVSEWCAFECKTMRAKQPRPWHDICRIAPLPQLDDRRHKEFRPSRWACFGARLRNLRRGPPFTPSC